MKTTINQWLKEAANNYYNGKSTGMGDKNYDALLQSEKNADPTFNIFDHVTYDVDQVYKPHLIRFVQPKSKSVFEKIEEYRARIEKLDIGSEENRMRYRILPKWDGCSIVAYYRDGKLVCILTRAGEKNGVDQTEKLRKKVPASVDPSVLKIEFEACTSVEDCGDKCRAKANGLINSKYMQEEVDALLVLIPFNVETTTNDADHLEYRFAKAGLYEDLCGFDERYFYPENCTYIYKGKTYPIDGMVVYDDREMNFRIHKFYYVTSVVTEITGYQYNFGDKMNYIPKVILKKIKIDGSNVTKVASGSYAKMQEKRIGIGAQVRVIKSGSTIPFIVETIVPSDDFGKPVCHYCGSDLKIIGRTHRCDDVNCSGIRNLFTISAAKQLVAKDKHPEIFEGLDTKNLNGEMVATRVDRLMDGHPQIKQFATKLATACSLDGLKGKRKDSFIQSIVTKLLDGTMIEATSFAGLTAGNNKVAVHYRYHLQEIYNNYRAYIIAPENI